MISESSSSELLSKIIASGNPVAERANAQSLYIDSIKNGTANTLDRLWFKYIEILLRTRSPPDVELSLLLSYKLYGKPSKDISLDGIIESVAFPIDRKSSIGADLGRLEFMTKIYALRSLVLYPAKTNIDVDFLVGFFNRISVNHNERDPAIQSLIDYCISRPVPPSDYAQFVKRLTVALKNQDIIQTENRKRMINNFWNRVGVKEGTDRKPNYFITILSAGDADINQFHCISDAIIVEWLQELYLHEFSALKAFPKVNQRYLYDFLVGELFPSRRRSLELLRMFSFAIALDEYLPAADIKFENLLYEMSLLMCEHPKGDFTRFFWGIQLYMTRENLIGEDLSNKAFKPPITKIIAGMLIPDLLRRISGFATSIYKHQVRGSEASFNMVHASVPHISDVCRLLLIGLSNSSSYHQIIDKESRQSVVLLMEIASRGCKNYPISCQLSLHFAYASLTQSLFESFWSYDPVDIKSDHKAIAIAAEFSENENDRYKWCQEFRTKSSEAKRALLRYGYIDLAEALGYDYCFDLQVPLENAQTCFHDTAPPDRFLIILQIFVATTRAQLLPDAKKWLNSAIMFAQRYAGKTSCAALSLRHVRRGVFEFFSDHSEEIFLDNPGVRETFSDSFLDSNMEVTKFKHIILHFANKILDYVGLGPHSSIPLVHTSVSPQILSFLVEYDSLWNLIRSDPALCEIESCAVLSKPLIAPGSFEIDREETRKCLQKCLCMLEDLFTSHDSLYAAFGYDAGVTNVLSSAYMWLRVISGSIFGEELAIQSNSGLLKIFPGAPEGLSVYADRTLYGNTLCRPPCESGFSPPSKTSCLSMSFDQKDQLWITKYSGSKFNPITVRLPAGRSTNDSAKSGTLERSRVYISIQEIIKKSCYPPEKETKSVSDFWMYQQRCDDELKDKLVNTDKAWIGGYSYIAQGQEFKDYGSERLGILSRLLFRSLKKLLKNDFEDQEISFSSVNITDFGATILQHALDNGSSHAIKDIVQSIIEHLKFHRVGFSYIENDLDRVVEDLLILRNDVDVQRRPATAPIRNIPASKSASMNHLSSAQPDSLLSNILSTKSTDVLLIVDRKAANLPWERLPTFLHTPTTRATSLYQVKEWMAGCLKLERPKQLVSFILNPEENLPPTHQQFIQKFKDRGWKGVVGKNPGPEHYTKDLKESEYSIYIGHGWGKCLIDAFGVRRAAPSSSAVFLMGCDSLRVYDLTHPQNPLFSHTVRGSKLIVGTLWPVKDKDFNRYTVELLSRFFDRNERQIDAMHKARDGCVLPYLTGAATVSYGLPSTVYSKRRFSN